MKLWTIRGTVALLAVATLVAISSRLTAPAHEYALAPMPKLPKLAFPYQGAPSSSFIDVRLYRTAPPSAVAVAGTAMPLAKHEPATGVYLGMLGADKRVGFRFEKIESVYGRKHAMYLAYVGWRKVQTDTNTYFPKRVADQVKALGGALQIGWEPRYGLDDVLDDEYVRRFAREAKASGIPIFLRYASEMNGSWVPWHGDPKLYKQKFRLIHDIMSEEAPNVAMVWSPNFSPADTIDDYYPGDDAVDWVGFSLYAGPLDANDKLDLNGNSLIDKFAPLYAKYSRKPIMISEGAVAHTVLPSNEAHTEWAVGQLNELYGYIPRLFPQLKAITYFNFGRAQTERNKSKLLYDLGENEAIDAEYQRLIKGGAFLSEVRQGASSQAGGPYEPLFLAGGSYNGRAAGRQDLLVYARLEDGRLPYAIALYGSSGRLLDISYEQPWRMSVDLASQDAQEPIYAVAFDAKLVPLAVGEVKGQ